VPRRRGRFVTKYIPPAETLSDSVLCSCALEFRAETLSRIPRLKRSVRRRSIVCMNDDPLRIREIQDQNDRGFFCADLRSTPAFPARCAGRGEVPHGEEERFLSPQADPFTGVKGEEKVGLLRSE
jgi:hypothetical protein